MAMAIAAADDLTSLLQISVGQRQRVLAFSAGHGASADNTGYMTTGASAGNGSSAGDDGFMTTGASAGNGSSAGSDGHMTSEGPAGNGSSAGNNGYMTAGASAGHGSSDGNNGYMTTGASTGNGSESDHSIESETLIEREMLLLDESDPRYMHTACTNGQGNCNMQGTTGSWPHCQDPTNGRWQSRNRCWQKEFWRAAYICNQHDDCKGITQDGGGFEPRTGWSAGHHPAARHMWRKPLCKQWNPPQVPQYCWQRNEPSGCVTDPSWPGIVECNTKSYHAAHPTGHRLAARNAIACLFGNC